MSSWVGRGEILATSYLKARQDWPEDFVMQVHTFESQTQAALSFFNYDNPDVPNSIIEEIKIRAFTEWLGDYAMMLHELDGQIQAWLSIN